MKGKPQELQLLLCCARRSNAGDQVTQIHWDQLDWTAFFALANRHGMLPYAFAYLREFFPQKLVGASGDLIRLWYHRHVQRNQFLARELLHIFELFARNGIPALAIKGPCLAVEAHGDLALRQFDDLDLLVNPGDFTRVKNLLLQRGYRRTIGLAGKRETAHLRWQHEEKFFRDQGLAIDLHWRLTRDGSFVPHFPPRWIPLLGRSIPTLDRRELVLFLCLHGAKHSWDRLLWIHDLARLMGKPSFPNEDRFLAEARNRNLKRVLLLGLFLAHHLFMAPLSAGLFREIRADPMIESLAEEVCRRLFQGSPTASALARKSFFLRTQRGFQARARYLIQQCKPSSRDLALMELPRPLFPAYYLLRLLRLSTRDGLPMNWFSHRAKQSNSRKAGAAFSYTGITAQNQPRLPAFPARSKTSSQ